MKKPLYNPETGIHRAKVWEIMLFSLNNTSTNLTFVLFGAVLYYLNGLTGLAVGVISSALTGLRMWDAVTDPFVGYIVDKTNGKFGKNRPFILVGNIIQAAGSALIFFVIPTLPKNMMFVAYIVFYMIYIIGYTFQTVVTKSAQSCITNDPSQRPIFASFDTIFGAVIFSIIPLYSVNYLGAKHAALNGHFNELGKPIISAAYSEPSYFQELWLFVAATSFILAILAIIGLWRKDRTEFFGTGKIVRVGFKDYWDTIKNNRAIQMLIVAASSDKLTGTVQTNQPVIVLLFGVIVGSYNQYANGNALIGIPQALICALVLFFLASRLGQKKALTIGSIGGIVASGLMVALFYFGDPTTLSFTADLTTFTLLYVIIFVTLNVFKAMCAGMVITMNADCADYEVYRSGKYVPGLMGTLFSFVDKVVSSFSSVIVAAMIALIGYTDTLPKETDALTPQIFWITMLLFMGFPAMGWALNLVAMKFYPLTKEKMASIQSRIGEIKKEAQKQ